MARVELGTLNLLSERVSVQLFTFNPGYPDSKTHRRTLAMRLDFNAADAGQLASDVASVLAQIRAAEEAARGLDDGSRVAFLWQPDTRDPLYFDLLPDESGSCGSLVLDESATAWMTLGWVQGATLTLNCADYARGPVIVDAVSSTLTNGASLLYRGNVPGDAAALVRLSVTDVSTSSTYLQRLRIGARTSCDHVSGDYDPWIDAAAASGASTVTVAGTVGGSHARRAMTTAWQRVAEFTRPAGWLNVGRFHVVPRVRDNAVRIDAPTMVQVANGTPTLAYTGETDDPTSGTPQNATGSTYQDTSLTTVQLVFPGPVTAGNCLIVFAASNDNTPTLTAPAGWTQAKLQRFTGTAVESPATYDCSGWCYYKVASGPGDTASTWTINDGTAGLDISGVEFSGLTATPLDKAVSASASSTLSSGTLAQANELAFLFTFTAAGPALDQIPSPPTGSTPWKNVPAWGWAISPDNPSTDTDPLAANQTGGGTNTNGNIAMRITRSRARLLPKVGASVWASNGQYGVMIITFKALVSDAGFLPLGQVYESVVCAVDASGNVGPASPTVSAFVDYPAFFNQQPASVYTDWDAPADGATPAQYRSFLRIVGGDWYYRDTGSTATTYAWTSFDGATVGDPPAYTSTLSDWRLRIGLSSGTVTYPLDSWRSELGDGAWEQPHDAIRGGQTTVTLPPSVAEEGSAPRDWLVAIEAKNDSGQTANADVDAAAFLPAEHSTLLLEYRDSAGAFGGLAALRTWQYDQRRDGRHSAVLLNAGTEAGQLYHEGWLSVGPGDVTIVALADVGGAVSDVTNAKLTMQVQLTPRYLYLAP